MMTNFRYAYGLPFCIPHGKKPKTAVLDGENIIHKYNATSKCFEFTAADAETGIEGILVIDGTPEFEIGN